MNWMDGMAKAIAYMEGHLKEEVTMENVAKQACVSSFYFQTIFSALCGLSVAEYIRFRRLTLAGSEVVATDRKIIDIALDYGYDSPDSFTKAFVRFHGTTPSSARKQGGTIRAFAPLKIEFTLKGGMTMDYKIIEKDAFTVMGSVREFSYDNNTKGIPDFWTEHYQKGLGEIVCGMYGVCIDEGKKDSFLYMIADDYKPWKEVPQGFETKVIPAGTWAVFPCKGSMPEAIQKLTGEVFSQWLPNQVDYEMSGKYNIELYSPVADYPLGNKDKNYYSEIWMPVKKK